MEWCVIDGGISCVDVIRNGHNEKLTILPSSSAGVEPVGWNLTVPDSLNRGSGGTWVRGSDGGGRVN